MKKEKSMKQLTSNTHTRGKKIVAFALSAVFLTASCPIAFAAEDSSAPLTPEQISSMTHEQLSSISQEQSDATLNKMVQMLQNGEKEALDEYLSAMGFATTYEEYSEQKERESQELSERAELNPGIQPLWESDYKAENTDKQCHEAITGNGFLVYIGAMIQLFNMSGDFGYTVAEMQTLMTESAWPDKNDWITLYAGHFYDPDTGKNFLNSDALTARTNAHENYNKALTNYQQGNRAEAIKYLAHSIHFIQDVGVPHHAANYIAGASNHSDFEAMATEMIFSDDFSSALDDWEYDISFYNNVPARNMSLFTHTIASTSKPLINVASDENNVAGQRIVAASTLLYSVQNTSGVLYRFAKDVGMI